MLSTNKIKHNLRHAVIYLSAFLRHLITYIIVSNFEKTFFSALDFMYVFDHIFFPDHRAYRVI